MVNIALATRVYGTERARPTLKNEEDDNCGLGVWGSRTSCLR